MDITLVATTQVAGAGLQGVIFGAVHQPVDPVQEGAGPLRSEVGNGGPGQDPLDEESLAGPVGADAGEHALIEQPVDDQAAAREEAAGGFLRIPVGAQDIRTEVPHERALIAGADEVEHAEAQAEGRPVGGPHGCPQV